MAKVLITGCAGFLGSSLARTLAQQGHAVVANDTLHPDEAWRLKGVPLESFLWQDVADLGPEHLPEYIVHCAASVDVGNTMRSPRLAVHQSIIGTVGLLEAARRAGYVAGMASRRIVLISSYSAYGKVEKQPIVETEPLNPTTLYGAMKAAQEAIALSYFRSHALPVVVIRSSTIYGPRSRATLPVRLFLTRALRGEPIQITGDGSQIREQCHVEDTARGIDRALFMPAEYADRVNGQVFNIGAGQGIAIRRLAELCIKAAKEITGREVDIQHLPPRSGEEGQLELDCSKARRVLGYEPRILIEEGIRQTARELADRLVAEDPELPVHAGWAK